MKKAATGLVCIMTLLILNTAVMAGDITGKWTTPKGAVIECTATECKLVKGRTGEEDKGVGLVSLKEIQVKEGKGTAKLFLGKDQWADMKIEVGDKEINFTGPRGGKFSWKRLE